jgi:hypothetical protein
MKNDRIKYDRIKSDHIKNGRTKSDRIKSITDPYRQYPVWTGLTPKRL